MLGPFRANEEGVISYNGNNIFAPIEDVSSISVPVSELENRVKDFKNNPMWSCIARINHRINISANNYFDELGAFFTALPLTTRMISSPGAVYGKEAINYTTDTCPITLNWFDLPKGAFLSESSQIYLELALIQNGIDHVYSIYNSFRKEKGDATHLSEFHHIEYEGHVTQKQNENISLGLVGRILSDLIKFNEKDLAYFLSGNKIKELDALSRNIRKIPRIPYREVQNLLYKETRDKKYKNFTMQNCFGSWEEIKLTEIVGGMVAITQFPLLEVPFYHARVDGIEHPTQKKHVHSTSSLDHTGHAVSIAPREYILEGKSGVADNTDIIWPGYRETIGSGHRVRSKKELEEKAIIFQLPKKDYAPYLQTRDFRDYRESSGFGLGWERLLQGLLEMPFIWNATHFPRVDKTLKP